MSAFAGKILAIEQALLTMLTNLTLDTGAGPEQLFQIVTDDPSQEINGEPYCELFPDTFKDEKVEVGANDYTIPFNAMIVLKLEKTSRSQPATYQYMYNIVETVLNALDIGDFNNALNGINSGIGTYLMDTSTVAIRPSKSKSGVILLARLQIAVKYQFEL
jgi:hypothetical protein